ncbi:MAG: 16S rRNA (cytosine(1402)-N(4))-methyltransferase RsmH [Candidatus Buchananbacteria bacterium]
MRNFHQPVMLGEVIHYLQPKAGDNFIDCTLGGGGHTEELLKRIAPSGKVLGIDLDPLAIQTTQEAIKNHKGRLIIAKGNFSDLAQIVKENKFTKVKGILLDLGLSSGQLRDHNRGFSFLAEGSLDMRFGAQSETTAETIINSCSPKALIEIFKNFGEESLAKPIVDQIVYVRKKTPITKPAQLVEIVCEVYKKYYRAKSKFNPATKVFQALRIAVNEELQNLTAVLPAAMNILQKNGRLVVISYHSLEDRTVKEFFATQSRDCICPPKMPLCQCTHKKSLKIITKKPISATDLEILENPRARSAKIRVAQKI